MRQQLKRSALSLLSSPLPYRLLQKRALRDDPLTILCYHTLRGDAEDIDAWTALRISDFRQQVAILRDTYDIVDMDQALGPTTHRTRPRAVLTFDDGDVGLFTHLLPIVVAEGLPVTLYIATGQIETGQPYWFDRVMNALQAPGLTRIDLVSGGLKTWEVGPETGSARWMVISDILDCLKSVQPDTREALTADLVTQAKRQAPDTPGVARDSQPDQNPFTGLGPMSVDALKQLAACPYVTIGAHSHCHNLLDQIPLDAARESAVRSRVLLRDWTGQDIRHFAYPNGNHNATLQAMLAELGFASATVLDMALSSAGSDPFSLSRLAIGRYDSLNRFQLRLVGM